MFISIIICTYNRAPLLKRCLQSLACQTVKSEQFEIIVVDDGSKDDTPKVCERMLREMPMMRYVSTGTNTGLGSASNRGIGLARGECLLFTDDDCIPQKDWIKHMSATLTREHIVAGAVASPVSNYVKLCHNIAEFHPFMPGRKAGPVEFIAGANMGFRRSVLEELSGFQESHRAAPDMQFILRARLKGYRIYFEPGAVVLHDHSRTTLGSIFKYSLQHAAITILLRNQYRSLLRTPFVLRSPVLILAASPFIALKVTKDIYIQNLRLIKHFWTLPIVFALKLAWCWGAARGLHKHNSTKKDSHEKAGV